MNRRTAGFVVAGSAFALLLLAASIALFSTGTRAAAPNSAASGVKAQAAPRVGAPSAPSVSNWVDIAPFPTVTIEFTPVPTSLKLKRAGAAAYPPNGKLYVMGGRHGIDGEDISQRLIWEYTPGSPGPGTWISKTALLEGSSPGERTTANMAVAVLTDAGGVRIYAIGGNDINSNPASLVRVYNPVADSLTTLTTDPWPASPARVPGGYAVYNNKLYIFGGFSALGTGAVYTDTWRFDPLGPSGGKWTQLAAANLNLGRAYIAGAALDGMIYAIGGDTWNPSTRQLVAVPNVERLDPSAANPSWTVMNNLPGALGDMGAWAYDTGTGYEISGAIVVAGGGYPIPQGKAFKYNPASDSWSSFPALLHATRNYGSAQLNGQLYAFGGYDYSNNTPSGANFSQRYDATGPTPTPSNTPVVTPTPTGTPFSTNYNVCSNTGASIDPGTTLVAGSQCGDCVNTISLPFAYTLYDQSFTSARVAANGTLGFLAAGGNLVNTCLPDASANYAIMAYWDDLDTTGAANGIYTSTTGVAPNRVYNVEWRGTRVGGSAVNFEIRLFEGQTQFEIVYGAVSSGGNSATVGVQRDTGSLFTQFECNTASLSAGQRLLFTQSVGTCPTNTPTFTSTPTFTRTPTVTGTPPTFTPTNTATATPCGTATNYQVAQSTGAAIVPGTVDIGNHTDDGVTAISLPFSVRLYGQVFNSANLSSNGNVQFSSTSNQWSNACLPTTTFNNVILAHWDDLRTDAAGSGIFTSTTGSAPNRIFNIEWRATYFTGGASLGFEVRLYEGQDKFDIIYGSVPDGGSGATVGVQRDTGSLFTQFECNTVNSLTSGLQLTFTQPPCSTSPTPTFTPGAPTSTNTPSATNTPTRTPTPTATCPPSNADVSIGDNFFNPTTITVNVGTTVTWTNGGGRSHTSTSDTAIWDSSLIGPGGTFSFTFNSVGSFAYHCNVHPTEMTGTITVIAGCAPTATRTSTRTATPVATPALVGHVTWQGPPAQPSSLQALPISLTLRLQSGGPDNEYSGLTTDASGFFTVPLGAIPDGTYLWRVKGPKYLATGGNTSLTGGVTTNVEMGLEAAGDCNNSNNVDATDFTLLKATFGKSQGQPGYDDRADFNGDQAVNVSDFSLQRVNFGTAGAPPLGPTGGQAARK